MVGININCKYQDFVDQILNGEKTIETRDSNSLKKYTGQRVGLIKTGCGKATLEGYVTIGKIIRIVDNKDTFDSYYQWHRVGDDTPYAFKKVKYMYQLYNPERCAPTEITSKGIVARVI